MEAGAGTEAKTLGKYCLVDYPHAQIQLPFISNPGPLIVRAPPAVGWACLHQLAIKKLSNRPLVEAVPQVESSFVQARQSDNLDWPTQLLLVVRQ